ncbi:SRPBCC domain-containing protein [Streptomyces sp. NPDC127084]|uniref:SRPBCC domain-containing protein n=1 Tax=Streptomyces sp. NPDC127084 TaxID=3347133 RepID=UPI00365D0383
MEHEVFVPVPAEALRQTLADPARVARCVPGLQRDADASAGPLTGRLRVRVGSHTITYRGELRISERSGGDFAIEGEGIEARGSGAVKLALILRLTPAEGGTTLGFSGTSHAEGRLAGLPQEATAQTAIRLLERFASGLTLLARGGPSPAGAGATAEPAEETDAGPGTDKAQDTADEDLWAEGARGEDGTNGTAGVSDASGGNGADDNRTTDGNGTTDDNRTTGANGVNGGSVFDVDVPPSALDPLAQDEFGAAGEPPAEAAHARRTMIGRSAEEVDHAPPRGRYAPVPAPQSAAAAGALRWIGPAAAIAIASAVVVGRALRRRRL